MILSHCPTNSLKEWFDAHWYYLPEAIEAKNYQEWCETLLEIKLELASRGVVITFELAEPRLPEATPEQEREILHSVLISVVKTHNTGETK